MTYSAVAQPYDPQQHGVIVAVDENPSDCQPIPRRFALHPERASRTAEEGGVARSPRLVEGGLVHEAHHQDLIAVIVLHNGWYQAIELGKVHYFFVSFVVTK